MWYSRSLSLSVSITWSLSTPPLPAPPSHCIINGQKVIPSCAVTGIGFFYVLSNFCGFNKKNLSFLLFPLTVLSVLFNSSSPVVSEDEKGQRMKAEEGRAVCGLRERRREKCRVDKLILFCDKQKANIRQRSILIW